MATDDNTLKGFMGKHFTIYIMAVDQWLQFFSHLEFEETRGRLHDQAIRRKNEMLLQYSCLAATCVRKSPPFALLRYSLLHWKSGCCHPSADCFCVLSTGLHQFQRQRSMCDPVPSAVCVQPHIFPAGAQPQSQVHLWSLLCEEMSP